VNAIHTLQTDFINLS